MHACNKKVDSNDKLKESVEKWLRQPTSINRVYKTVCPYDKCLNVGGDYVKTY